MRRGHLVTISPPRGRKAWPTIVSMIELLPALWLPTQMMEGKRPVKSVVLPCDEEASCSLLRQEASSSRGSDMSEGMSLRYCELMR